MNFIKWAVGVVVTTTPLPASASSGGAGVPAAPIVPRLAMPPPPLSLARITNDISTTDPRIRSVVYNSSDESDSDVHDSSNGDADEHDDEKDEVVDGELDHPGSFKVILSPPKIDPETLVPDLVAFFDEYLRSPEYIRSVRESLILNEDFIKLLALSGPLTPEMVDLVRRTSLFSLAADDGKESLPVEPGMRIPRRSSVRFVDEHPVEEVAPFVAPCNGFIPTTVPRLRSVLAALRRPLNAETHRSVNVALHHLATEASFYLPTPTGPWHSILVHTQARAAVFFAQSDMEDVHGWSTFSRLNRLIVGRLLSAAAVACPDPAPVDMRPFLVYARSLQSPPGITAVTLSESKIDLAAAWVRLRHEIKYGSSVALLVALRSPLTRDWGPAQSFRRTLVRLADKEHSWTNLERDKDVILGVLDAFVRALGPTPSS